MPEPTVPTIAIVTRRTERHTAEVFVIEFRDGIAGFMKWSAITLPGIEIVAANEGLVPTGVKHETYYDADTEANVVAYLVGPRPKLYAWKMSDVSWAYMKQQAELQERDSVRGRPSNPVQPLQTWRMWAKKQGAYI